MIVVDASVATKWFLPEPDSEDALGVLTSGLKLVGPTLAKYEVAAAFYRRARDNEIPAEEADACRQRWLQAVATNVMRLEQDDRDIALGGEIAVQLKHVLPDCIYLAMAQRLNVPLVTADAAFAKKARRQFDGVLNISQARALAA